MAGEREDSGLIELEGFKAPVGEVGPLDGGSGLIDIRVLESAGLVGEGEVPTPDAAQFEAAQSAAQAAQGAASGERPPQKLGFWLVAAGLVSMAAAIGLVLAWAMLRDGHEAPNPGAVSRKAGPASASVAPMSAAPATEAPATEAPATEAPATEAPATEAPATEALAAVAPSSEAAMAADVAPLTAAPDAPISEAPVTGEPAAPVTEAPAAPVTEAPATEAPAAPVTEAPATEPPAAPVTEAPATDAKKKLPRQLSKKEVTDTVQANAPTVRRCQKFATARTTVNVAVVLDRSGRVYRADAEPPEAESDLGRCVERAVRKFEFPPFGGDPMRIRLPYAF